MWVRIKPSLAMFFTGKDPRQHHDAEERLKILLREALADRKKPGRLNGKTLRAKWIAHMHELGYHPSVIPPENPTPSEEVPWDLLAEEIADAYLQNGRELAKAYHAIEEAKGCLDVGNRDLALRRLEEIDTSEEVVNAKAES